ncbi:MAG: LuxR family transcriptional regulator [Bacteroidales bacterium]|nr:LuxR family transcriptional regulator [Bacteroidales bacterium]
MKRIVPSIIFLMAFCHLSSAEYIDHRGHNIDSLQAVVNNNAKDSAYFNAVFNLASAYRQSDPHFALELSRILVNEYPNHGWPRLAAAGADNISIYYRAKGVQDSALVWSLKAFDFIEDMRAGGRYDEDKIDDEYSRCCGGIGNVYCEMGDYEKSIEYYLKALEIFEKHNWIESKTILYGNLGYLYEETGDFKEAGRCLLKCMENAKESGDSAMVAFGHSQLGEYYIETGKYKKAQKEYLEADIYYSTHEDEEQERRLETLDNLNVIRQAQLKMYRTITALAIVAVLLLTAVLILFRKSRHQEKVISETSEVFEETIDSLPVPKPDQDMNLNDREIDILKMLADGKDSKYMAEKLSLSLETIYWYRKRLRVKFNTNSTTAIISEAIRRGLI